MLVKPVKMNIESFLVPSLKLPEERPIDKRDYEKYIQTNSDLLNDVNKIDFSKDKDNFCSALIFIAEHSNISGWSHEEESMCWSSQNHEVAVELIKTKIVDSENISFQIMISDIFEEILTKLEPNLKNWAENPAACHALAFIIYQLNIETIEKYLGRLLPFVLRWSDSWIIRPRLLAARLLDRLLDIPSASYTKFGRDNVVYDALIKSLSCQDACVLQVSLGPLRKVLEMTCKDEDRISVSTIDHFMSKLFTSIDLETKVEKKNLKVELLSVTWSILERATNRWIHRLAPLVVGELDLVSSVSCGILLDMWRKVCLDNPAPAARESKVIFPALVQAIWKVSHGYIGTDTSVEMDSLILTLSKQISVDQDTFILFTNDIETVTKNQRFLQAIETAKSLA